MSSPRSSLQTTRRPDRQDQIGTLSAGSPGIAQGCAQVTYRGQVWISTDDYAVMRIQASRQRTPHSGLTCQLDSEYTRTALSGCRHKTPPSATSAWRRSNLTIQYGEYHIYSKPGRSTERMQAASVWRPQIDQSMSSILVVLWPHEQVKSVIRAKRSRSRRTCLNAIVDLKICRFHLLSVNP